MTISKDLFLSILSMDAYNRGYDPGIDGLSGTGVGHASFVDTPLPDGSKPASFYALAYKLDRAVGGVPGPGGTTIDSVSAGTTIISYRGTDQVPPSLENQTWEDGLTGWTLGAGSIPSRCPLVPL